MSAGSAASARPRARGVRIVRGDVASVEIACFHCLASLSLLFATPAPVLLSMEPHQLTPQERLDLYAAWYRILLRKLPNRASHGDEMLESLLDAGLHHFADTHSLPLSREHIAHWDPERLDRVYGHLFALAEKVFLQRFSPTETVSAARSLVRNSSPRETKSSTKC